MIKAIVTGAGGRMGGRIIDLIGSTEGIELAGAVESPGHPLVGHDAGERLGLGRIGVAVVDNLALCIEGGDVIIDFTRAEASLVHLEMAVERGRALVIGSTGFSTVQRDRLRELAPGTRCVFSPNMSVGVNVMFQVLRMAAEIIGRDYDVELMEIHHNLKKDAPSGTALKMAEIIALATGRDLARSAVYGRKGLTGERTKEEIGIQTMRAGDIVGEHTVMFAGQGERLEFIHRAHSRDNFASGAIRAAKWLVNQPPGLYEMADVLGFR
ncbi:MAG: 4-hydroxy-tetrahydrodipicolinate reductase [Smithellaceae bacterium]|nr:4-hydroxy-tetrahydrodipicolinate reductase [Smithellaceae bacterium]